MNNRESSNSCVHPVPEIIVYNDPAKRKKVGKSTLSEQPFVTLCLNLDGQLCRDLNSGARGVVAKHLPTRPRSLSTGYS